MPKTKKHLGQHFLRDVKILQKIIDAADIKNTDTVVEIGPGEGHLTKLLLKKAKKVIAIEKDLELASKLKAENLEVISGDILEVKIKEKKYKLVGNIPYYITGAIFEKFLESENPPETLTFVVQKEVAERIMAKDKKESVLSISIKAYGKPEYGGIIKAGSFVPPPKVDSAIISIRDISRERFEKSKINEKDFFKLVKKGFSHKRKLLAGNLGLQKEKLKKLGIGEMARAEDLRIEDWFMLSLEHASRKVISIFIVATALVVTIIIISPSATTIKNKATGINTASRGPQVQIEENAEWQEDYKEFGIEISEAASSTETLTDEFSRSLMANFLSLKQSGGYDSSSATNLLNKSNEFINNSFPKISLSLKDTVTSPDNSLAALTKYGNDLGQALKINKPKEIKNEVEIFGKMMETQDPSLSIEIENVAEIYKATVISLSRIIVPSSLANEHLKFTTNLKIMAESTSNFARGIDDPLKATNSITEYNTAFDNMIKARANIQNSLLKSGVHYKQGDPAFFLYFGI